MDSIIIKWVGTLITALKLGAASIAGRIFAGMGLTFVSFTYALPAVKSWLAQQAQGLGPQAIQLLSATGVDVFMTLIISALVARIGMKTVLMLTSQLESMINQAGG
ncbi:DUF2523 family protein [Lysobacter yananisis]|uniref:DUF2523 family protein n=1 Tax=Lysobacter yananisis TaxID=1003114 RepID=A0ABY9P597_9GAMM|nr:DUF2523 family protein [Lysobacter yananisis]WMT02086.1 DUF2523 family protein [Lysobacter yananisis]